MAAVLADTARMTRIGLLAGFLLTGMAGPAAAGSAAIVVDADSGAVLYENDSTVPWYPASLTKMMTIYLAFEAIDEGRLSLADIITASAHAAAQPPTRLGLKEGYVLTVDDAIRAIITRSANDVAVALAERLAGHEETFAAFMTVQARVLGMTATQFRNATGLPDHDQVTTARDMAVLGRALLKDFPHYYHYFSARAFSFGGRTLPTYNGILTSYPGADGIKTGFTCGSGYNLVASARRGGRRLIGVLLGSSTRGGRAGEMARLLDRGFAAEPDGEPIRLEDLAAPENAVAEAPRQRLSSNECAASGLGIVTSGPLPGWGLALGSFPAEDRARKAIATARTLVPSLGMSRSALVKPARQGRDRFSAVLVGLGEEAAREGCRNLRAKGEYCIVLSPEMLNNPSAQWR